VATTVTKTIRSSGGDYTSLSAWAAAEVDGQDLVTADEVRVAECYDDWPTGLEDNNIGDSTVVSDATRYPKITVASGHRHDGTLKGGFFLSHEFGSGSEGLNLGNYSVSEWVAYDDPIGSSNSLMINVSQGGVARQCIVHSVKNDVRGIGTSEGGKIHNCIAIDCSRGLNCVNRNSNEILNSTVIGCVTGIWPTVNSNSGDSTLVSNVVAYLNDDNYASSSYYRSGSTNNAASDASTNTPPGANPILTDIVAGDFVDAANEDYHLASGSTLIDAGADLSPDVVDDIDGDSRTAPYDVGADEFVSAGADHSLTATDIATGSPAIESAALSQQHGLTAQDVATAAPVIGSATITQHHSLAAADVVTAAPVVESATPGTTGTDALTAQDVATATPVVEAATIAQAHDLTAQDTATPAPVVESATITQAHDLTAQDVATASPALESASLGSDTTDALTAQDLATSAPTVDSPALAQAHDLIALDVATTNPVLESSTLTQEHTLASSDVVTGAPVISSPVLSSDTADAVTAQDVSTGAPTLASASVSQNHALQAAALVTAAPVVDLAALGQHHLLTATDLATGAPVVGSASLNAAIISARPGDGPNTTELIGGPNTTELQ